MLVKTRHNNTFHDPQINYITDDIIGVQLTTEEHQVKLDVFADFGGNETTYYGDIGRIIYHYLI